MRSPVTPITLPLQGRPGAASANLGFGQITYTDRTISDEDAFAPRLTGDVLAVGECITVTPASALPAGLNIAYAFVTAPNTVQIGLSASIAIAGSSMAWTVVAHR